MDYNLQMILFKIRIAIKNYTFLGRYLINRDLINLKEEYTFLNSNYNSNRITKIQNNIINLEYIKKLEVKLKNKIGRKVIFCLDSTDNGIVLYDKNTTYYEN